MSWTEIEIDESGNVTVRRGGTLTGETEVEPKPMAEPETEPMKGAPVTKPASAESIVESKPKLVTWRLCVLLEPWQIDDKTLGPVFVKWHPSENIPQFWYPVESYNEPIETVKQLPEGQKPY